MWKKNDEILRSLSRLHTRGSTTIAWPRCGEVCTPLALAKRSSEGVLICLWNTNLPNNLILYFQNFFINSVSDRFVIVVKWQQWERKAECVSMLSLIIATVVDDIYLTIKFLKKLFACAPNNSTRNSSLMELCYVITTFSFHFFLSIE